MQSLLNNLIIIIAFSFFAFMLFDLVIGLIRLWKKSQSTANITVKINEVNNEKPQTQPQSHIELIPDPWFVSVEKPIIKTITAAVSPIKPTLLLTASVPTSSMPTTPKTTKKRQSKANNTASTTKSKRGRPPKKLQSASA